MTTTTTASRPLLHGVHHTARPTWKLRETVEFYRDKLGLPLIHAISARGWGPSNHPDFLHFFFDSGNGSTIAFFYYIGSEQPDYTRPVEDYPSRATHTAWRVHTIEELEQWKSRLEAHGIELRFQLRHELIESIYFSDPNGYPLEITMEVRPMNALDAIDAQQTMEAAMAQEDLLRQPQGRFENIDQVWRDKANRRGESSQDAVLHVLDVPEFEPLVRAARAQPTWSLTGPTDGYWRIASSTSLVFERKPLGFVPALWNAALTGGFSGEVAEFDRYRLEIRAKGTA